MSSSDEEEEGEEVEEHNAEKNSMESFSLEPNNAGK